MHIHAVQFDVAWEDRSANHDRVRSLLDATPPPANALVVLPEMFASGFSMAVERISDSAQNLTHAFLQDLARQHQVTVMAGLVRTDAHGQGFNQATVIDPTGHERGRYSKIHLFQFANETAHYQAGTEPIVLPLDRFRVAPLICYDLRFPETFRAALAKRANLFVVIANWPAARIDHWTTLLKARAIENQAYVVGLNRVGTDPSNTYNGQSRIIGPRGELLAEADDREQILQAQLDRDALDAYRAQFPTLPTESSA